MTDKIERLRAERNEFKRHLIGRRCEVERLRIDNERLRAALQFYADDCGDTGLIARRALETKP